MAQVLSLALHRARPAQPELALLLNAAGQALDRLWTERAMRDTGVLLPDYLDPGLVSVLEGPEGTDAAPRAALLQIGAQMRRVGLGAVARAVLEMPWSRRRQRAVLALAGCRPWRKLDGEAGAETWRRDSADGLTYRLAARPDGGAAHAPHAIRDLVQHFWLEAEAGAPEVQRGGEDCLSLRAALRDVAVMLRAGGEDALAAQVAALETEESLAPAAAAEPRRPEPAAA